MSEGQKPANQEYGMKLQDPREREIPQPERKGLLSHLPAKPPKKGLLEKGPDLIAKLSPQPAPSTAEQKYLAINQLTETGQAIKDI